jgi:hypothetical protein
MCSTGTDELTVAFATWEVGLLILCWTDAVEEGKVTGAAGNEPCSNGKPSGDGPELSSLFRSLTDFPASESGLECKLAPVEGADARCDSPIRGADDSVKGGEFGCQQQRPRAALSLPAGRASLDQRLQRLAERRTRAAPVPKTQRCLSDERWSAKELRARLCQRLLSPTSKWGRCSISLAADDHLVSNETRI